MINIIKACLNNFIKLLRGNARLKIIESKIEQGTQLFFYVISPLDTKPIKVSSHDLISKFQYSLSPNDLLRAQHMHEKLFNKLNKYFLYEMDFERGSITLIRPLDGYKETVWMSEILHGNLWKKQLDPEVLAQLVIKNSFSVGACLWKEKAQQRSKPNLYLIKK